MMTDRMVTRRAHNMTHASQARNRGQEWLSYRRCSHAREVVARTCSAISVATFGSVYQKVRRPISIFSVQTDVDVSGEVSIAPDLSRRRAARLANYFVLPTPMRTLRSLRARSLRAQVRHA